MNRSFRRFFGIVSLLFVPGFATAQTAEVTYTIAYAVPVFGSGIALLLGLALLLTGWVWLKKNPDSSYSKLATGILALGMLASVTSGGWLVSNANAVIQATTYLFSENASPVIVSSFPATLENDLTAPATLRSIDVTGCQGIEEITGSCEVGMTLAEAGGNCSLDSVCNDSVIRGEGTVRHTDGSILGVTYELCGTGDPGTCDAAAAKSACQAIGMKVVSHASNGTSEVFSLGATQSCHFSTSYFTVNGAMPTDSCLVGVSNLEWSTCCGTSQWHGNTIPFGNPGDIFGHVYLNDSGYVPSNPNFDGRHWGCQLEGSAANNYGSCATQFVACTLPDPA
jgi:hypothetical protein